MPYLNLDLDYFSHPKTMRLVGLLGKDSAVLPIRLWCYVGKYHSTNGKLAGYSPQEIESIVNWWGKQGQMIEAMIKVGFLSEINGGYEVKDWLGHQGHLKMFKERAQLAANKRWGMSNATSNAKDDAKQSPVPTVPTKPDLPNQTKPNNPVPDFSVFWGKYPNHEGKKAAERHYNASVKTLEDFRALESALENYLKCEKVKKGYVKMGSTWFNDWQSWVNPTPEMMGNITPAVNDKPKFIKLNVMCSNCDYKKDGFSIAANKDICQYECPKCKRSALQRV